MRLQSQRNSVRYDNHVLKDELESVRLLYRDELDWLKESLNTMQLEKEQDMEEKKSLEYQIKVNTVYY
jgi:hypothetical protein